jgi:gp16 family phage-associated protein
MSKFTPQQAKDWFDRHGVSVSNWARLHGFSPSVVFSLLAGRCTGRRGQAHYAAIALGLKSAASPLEASPLEVDPRSFASDVLIKRDMSLASSQNSEKGYS